MINTKAMNNEMLTKVTGGDNGDVSYERKNGIALYKVGDQVEVYRTDLHITTRRAVVEAVREYDGYITYYVVFLDSNKFKWVTANGIQR